MATNENHLKLMFLLMLSCLWISFAAARDTLELGDTLNSSSYLVSAKRAFTLGFFHYGSTSNIYLGIWFTNDPKKIVWVGNRNAPVVNTAMVLTLETKGNFKILPHGGDAISLYSHQATNYTYTLFATLLDSGNFVLQELDSNGTTQTVLWQSFDEPTDTLLPGMKLGVNHKNGRPWSLTSWLNEVVPVPGQFSLEWDPKGRQLIIRRQGVEFWTSGVLKGTKKWIWVGIAIGVIPLVVIFFCILCHLSRRRNSDDGMLELMNSDTFTTVNELQNDRKQGNDLRIFSYKCIMSATNNFSLENKLGEGGFGLVYKGIFSQGQEIAIKRLSRNSGQGMLEFKNELILISELQHMNLVQLLGFCIHEDERMLIYEYMPNKSLDYFLFDSTKSRMLDWPTRFSIIEGIAQGLLYLHKYSRLRVIHRDLKASNILLDENMNPKISDFGMARIFQQNELEANTRRIVGTYGYMSPEYAMEGVFSIKSDVYSFGVLLLEIVSGRKSNNFYHTKHLVNLVGYAWELWKEDAMLDFMDPTLSDSFIKDQMFRCIHVGLLCIGDSAIDRPTMSDVIAMLANDSLTLPSPEKPIFSIARKAIEAHTCEKESENYSINGLSISNMVGR
ncbi:G-type lectin S-receptor-like serine/threonine-protein kinase At1g67520 [Quercus suber]|uniref:G-type lectin S-receptor-like serine/threonine-protein kinase At1g67520 n=1 Tax=Quercus suber TaxID=58331 RepID=UPI0032DEFC35